jgi:hypothetical protein
MQEKTASAKWAGEWTNVNGLKWAVEFGWPAYHRVSSIEE